MRDHRHSVTPTIGIEAPIRGTPGLQGLSGHQWARFGGDRNLVIILSLQVHSNYVHIKAGAAQQALVIPSSSFFLAHIKNLRLRTPRWLRYPLTEISSHPDLADHKGSFPYTTVGCLRNAGGWHGTGAGVFVRVTAQFLECTNCKLPLFKFRHIISA